MRCPWAQWQVCISSLRWVSTPPSHALFLLSPFSSRLIYLFPSGLSLLLFQSTLCWSAALICPPISSSLNSASQGKADRWGQRIHLWWSVYCPPPICRGPQYNILSIMHNTKSQSWVKDKSKEYCLSLDYGTGTKTAQSRAGNFSLLQYWQHLFVKTVCLLTFNLPHIFLRNN